ncbi:MAG: CRISPR-associated protein Cas7 [Bacteroidota bacterium]
MKPYIYLRALRHVDYTVFSVSDGQKTYYDPQFGTVAFSSGQQVKRSIIDMALTELNQQIAPIIFNYELKKDKVSEKEALSMADPSYPDQLLGGWMSAAQKSVPVKRRSPLSISAMRPLHPLLSSMYKENMTFDRSSHHGVHQVVVKDDKGNPLSEEDIRDFLTQQKRTLPARKFLQDQKRTGGLFVYDIAIDLRTLFSVSLNPNEPELLPEVADQLREKGWTEGQNAFGKCLICPKETREEIIPALAKALLHWRITSNQSRTFSLMATLAVAISTNANELAAAIRAKLIEERKAKVILEGGLDETALFVTLPAEAYILEAEGRVEALDLAEARLIELLQNFDYAHQLIPETGV